MSINSYRQRKKKPRIARKLEFGRKIRKQQTTGKA